MGALDRIVVTGASGFVGRALGARLARPFESLRLGTEDWRTNIERTDFRGTTVFHLAARVHREDDRDEAAYERDNVGKTRELGNAAAAAGARRLVFLSSVKVHGEETRDRPFRRDDVPRPRDAYARSKWAAEQELSAIARRTGLEVATVRAPLVFGPRAGGNLRSLMRIADSAWPLPVASIANRRSFVHGDDLARLLIACAEAPPAAGAPWLAANSRSVFSTPRLLALLRGALGHPARLAPFPPAALEAIASAIGQGERMRRLTRSLEVDASDTEAQLAWSAEISIEAAVEEMVAAYRSGPPS